MTKTVPQIELPWAIIDLLPPVNGVGFPRHRTAWLGVSGLQSNRHDQTAGGAKPPLLLSRHGIQSYRVSGIHSQRPEGIPSDVVWSESRYYPFNRAAKPPRRGHAYVLIADKTPG